MVDAFSMTCQKSSHRVPVSIMLSPGASESM
jgi:hypothetical protein